MKIVGLKEFLDLPPGTVAMKYEPIIVGELFVKEETIPETRDYFKTYLTNQVECDIEEAPIWLEAEETGKSINMEFFVSQRDGCFNDDQLFAVWEKKDVEGLIHRLTLCLANY